MDSLLKEQIKEGVIDNFLHFCLTSLNQFELTEIIRKIQEIKDYK